MAACSSREGVLRASSITASGGIVSRVFKLLISFPTERRGTRPGWEFYRIPYML